MRIICVSNTFVLSHVLPFKPSTILTSPVIRTERMKERKDVRSHDMQIRRRLRLNFQFSEFKVITKVRMRWYIDYTQTQGNLKDLLPSYIWMTICGFHFLRVLWSIYFEFTLPLGTRIYGVGSERLVRWRYTNSKCQKSLFTA